MHKKEDGPYRGFGYQSLINSVKKTQKIGKVMVVKNSVKHREFSFLKVPFEPFLMLNPSIYFGKQFLADFIPTSLFQSGFTDSLIPFLV